MSYPAKTDDQIDEAELRARGLIPKTIWVYDVDAPGFREECLRQARLIAEADARDPTINSFLEAAMTETFKEIDESEK